GLDVALREGELREAEVRDHREAALGGLRGEALDVERALDGVLGEDLRVEDRAQRQIAVAEVELEAAERQQQARLVDEALGVRAQPADTVAAKAAADARARAVDEQAHLAGERAQPVGEHGLRLRVVAEIEED